MPLCMRGQDWKTLLTNVEGLRPLGIGVTQGTERVRIFLATAIRIGLR